MSRQAVFVGGPKHGDLGTDAWTLEYIEPLPIEGRQLFSPRDDVFEPDHYRGRYLSRRYFMFGGVINLMVDDRLGPDGHDNDELNTQLAHALLGDAALEVWLEGVRR